VGGATVVVDAGAARGTGGVGGAALEGGKVGEAGDEGAAQGLAVRPPRGAV
jgi:hypothetical protein